MIRRIRYWLQRRAIRRAEGTEPLTVVSVTTHADGRVEICRGEPLPPDGDGWTIQTFTALERRSAIPAG